MAVRARDLRLLRESGPQIEFRGAHFLDIGCGGRHPFGTATLAAALGAASCTATDLVDLKDQKRAASAVWDLMAAIVMNPRDLLGFGAPSPEEACANLHFHFDPARLAAGDLYAAVRGRVEHKVGSFFDLEFPHQHYTISHSHTVLEHIHEIDGFAKRLFAITTAGGWSYHLVDLRDHRIYTTPEEHRWWHFLRRAERDNPWTRPGVLELCNRYRVPTYIAAFQNAGFEVVSIRRDHEEIPPAAIKDFEPEFQALSAEDLHTAILQLLVRKPG